MPSALPAPNVPGDVSGGAQLRRELGTFGASMLGLGSILGTGIFVTMGLAAGVAGSAVVLSIVLAAALATCNALSSAQLAAAYPVSGGTYEYGYRLLTPSLGFTAGWVFLCAKLASAATASLGAGGYLLHLLGVPADRWLAPLGVGIAMAMTALVASGLRQSSRVNIVAVAVTLLALTAFALAGTVHLGSGEGHSLSTFAPRSVADPLTAVLYATALMFVAYTGYARIATLGEEVRDPERTIPRAIVATLAVSAVLYVWVAIAAIGAIGADRLADAVRKEATPLEAAADVLAIPGLGLLVAAGAVSAMLGVLLNLVLGLSRVALAMGRRGDLPERVARVSARGTPTVAVVLIGSGVAALAALGRLETTWAFSALTVLIYYALTNLAALRLPPAQRLYPRWIAAAGLVGCLTLAVFIPRTIWMIGLGVLAAGFLWYVLARRWRTRPSSRMP